MNIRVSQISGDFDSAFRPLRLRAIRTEGNYFGWPYEDEAALSREDWNQKYCTPEGRVFFGVFVDDQLCGITAVTTWDGDITGKTALWSMTYLAPEHRGHGIATYFYKAREDYTRQHYDEVVMFIRDGNDRSEGIHKKHGALFWKSEEMQWNGKNRALWRWYRLHLKQGHELAA